MKRSVYIKAVDTYAGTLYRIACTYCRQHADAEDIVQTAFMKLYQTETEFQKDEHRFLASFTVTRISHRFMCSSS